MTPKEGIMNDQRRTFKNASHETDDVVLCLFCGETLHAPEDDVFWEDTAGHECEDMFVAKIARLTPDQYRREGAEAMRGDPH